MKKIKLFLFITSLIAILSYKLISKKTASVSKNITIFIHGTHTKLLTKIFNKTLYVKDLNKINNLNNYNYIKWLAEKVSKADHISFPLEYFYAFGWSGKLCNKERLKAAQKLYEEILKLKKELKNLNIDPSFTLITHSHGGNLALNLATIENIEKLHFDKLILLACPVQEETEEYLKNNIFKKVYSIYSKFDFIQILAPNITKNSILSKREFKNEEKLKQVCIKLNKRYILHSEFIFKDFPEKIPKILVEMDKLSSNQVHKLNI